MQASVEVNKKKDEVKPGMDQHLNETKAQQKLLRESRKLNADVQNSKMSNVIDRELNNLSNKEKKP